MNRSTHNPTFRNTLLIILAALLILAIVTGLVVRPSPPSTDELAEGIQAGAAYLTANVDANGRFTYLRHLEEPRGYGLQYNMLRHAGTIYAMCMAQELYPSEENRLAILRAVTYMRQTSLDPIDARGDVLAVWTTPAVTGNPLRAKLGGAGLGLIALASAERLWPQTVPLEEMQGLGRFILLMQREDGSFNTNYFAGRGPDGSTISQYYPGEAALGLVMLYELDGNPQWLEAALRGIGYMARSREGDWLVEPDHWSLLATERLWPYLNIVAANPTIRDQLLDHTRQVTRTILFWKTWYRLVHFTPPGCFVAWGKTTPTATRMEGVLAAANYLPPEQRSRRQRLIRASEEGAAFLLSTQMEHGPNKGAIPRAKERRWFYLPVQKTGKFNDRALEVRIDYVQHTVSALVRLQQLETR